MELINSSKSEINLAFSEKETIFELENEKKEKSLQANEEKHGVDFEINNKTSNNSSGLSASNLNNGLKSDFDRTKTNDDVEGIFERSFEEEIPKEEIKKQDDPLCDSRGETDAFIENNDISRTAKSKANEEDSTHIKNVTSEIEQNLNNQNHTEHDYNNMSSIINNDKNEDEINNLEELEMEHENGELKDEKINENNMKDDEDNMKDDEVNDMEVDIENNDVLKLDSEEQQDYTEIKCALKNKEATEDESKKEDELKLFDDTDLPLKATKRDGRGRKKKTTEPTTDSWDRVGKISGKIFDEEDEDDAYDYHNHYDYDADDNDEYTTFKQASMVKKASGDRQWVDGAGKKSKNDLLSRKLIKSPLVAEKKKPTETLKVRMSKSQLQRKEVWLKGWERKLQSVENELESRVAWVRKNEGRIMRQERRLAEKDALLGYREQLLLSIPLDNDDAIKKILEDAMGTLRRYAGWIDEQGACQKEGTESEKGGQNAAKVSDTLPFNNENGDGGGDVVK